MTDELHNYKCIDTVILPVGKGSHMMCSDTCTSVTELHVYWYGCIIDIMIQHIEMGLHIDID